MIDSQHSVHISPLSCSCHFGAGECVKGRRERAKRGTRKIKGDRLRNTDTSGGRRGDTFGGDPGHGRYISRRCCLSKMIFRDIVYLGGP